MASKWHSEPDAADAEGSAGQSLGSKCDASCWTRMLPRRSATPGGAKPCLVLMPSRAASRAVAQSTGFIVSFKTSRTRGRNAEPGGYTVFLLCLYFSPALLFTFMFIVGIRVRFASRLCSCSSRLTRGSTSSLPGSRTSPCIFAPVASYVWHLMPCYAILVSTRLFVPFPFADWMAGSLA